MKKAFEIDPLTILDNSNSKISSSAVDVVGILDVTIVKFWSIFRKSHLAKKTPQEYINLNISDYSRYTLIYLTLVVEQVEMLDKTGEKAKDFMSRFCVIMNNLYFVKTNFQTPISTLKNAEGIRSIILPELIKNVLRTFDDKKLEILELGLGKLKEIFADISQDTASDTTKLQLIEKTDNFIKENLTQLDKTLVKNDDKKRMRKIVLESFVCHIYQVHSQLKSSPELCENLQFFIKDVVKSFESLSVYLSPENDAKISEMKNFFQYYSLQTPSLIHKYYEEICVQQQQITLSGTDAALLATAFFDGQTLVVKILHARNLLAQMSLSQFKGSYVKLQFHPVDKFENIGELKTKVLPGTENPLFDKTFRM